jgi:hypothetical protein
MKLIATRRAEQNRAAFDPWTVVHFASGLAAGLMKIPYEWSLPAAVAYELAEQYVERQEWGREMLGTKKPESLPNAVVDVLAFAAGQWTAHRWNDTAEKRRLRRLADGHL